METVILAIDFCSAGSAMDFSNQDPEFNPAFHNLFFDFQNFYKCNKTTQDCICLASLNFMKY